MSPHSNEFAYAKEFVGNMRGESEPVPVQVTTRLRVMTEPQDAAIRRYSDHAFDRAPQYVFGGGNLPLDPNQQAVGRHYFTW